MTREERLDHIWSSTADAYRGYAGKDLPDSCCGRRVVVLYSGGGEAFWKRLDKLSDHEIAAEPPVHLRHLPSTIAA